MSMSSIYNVSTLQARHLQCTLPACFFSDPVGGPVHTQYLAILITSVVIHEQPCLNKNNNRHTVTQFANANTCLSAARLSRTRIWMIGCRPTDRQPIELNLYSSGLLVSSRTALAPPPAEQSGGNALNTLQLQLLDAGAACKRTLYWWILERMLLQASICKICRIEITDVADSTCMIICTIIPQPTRRHI